MADHEPRSVFFNPASLEAKARQEALLEDVQRRKAARSLALPTSDEEVKLALRAAGWPVTLFGEDGYDRRERLRYVLSASNQPVKAAGDPKQDAAVPEAASAAQQDFYTDGSAELGALRRQIVVESLVRAAKRLESQKKRFDLMTEGKSEPEDSVREAGNTVIEAMHSAAALASTVGDNRPLACCALDDSGHKVATGSWGGAVKVWNREGDQTCSLTAHRQRISSLAFHPSNSNILATAAADTMAIIHNLESKTETRLEGHVDRVADVAWHPFAPTIGTASFDSTWRLWDSEVGTQLLLQEGHVKPVYRVAFHPDGGLVSSSGLDCSVLLWDLRSGMCLSSFAGHMDQVLGLDFSSDGFHLASGGADNTIRIWDLRKRKTVYTIPAHSNIVSSLKFQKDGGHILVSSSYDRTCKIWSKRGWLLVRALTAFEEKVTCADVAADGLTVVTSCFDKTWKLWGSETQPMQI